MPRPLHLAGLIGLLALAAGCYDREPKRSVYAPGERFDVLASSGTRVLIEDPEGETYAKIRVHDGDRWEVFDSERVLVGIVDRRDDEIRARKGRTGEWRSVEQESNAWELTGEVRVEVLREGWAVFDGANDLVGYVAERDGQWEQRETYSGEATRTIGADGRLTGAGDELLFQVAGSGLSAPIVLMMTNDGLKGLAGVVAGVLIDSGVGAEERTKLRETFEASSEGDAGPPDASADL